MKKEREIPFMRKLNDTQKTIAAVALAAAAVIAVIIAAILYIGANVKRSVSISEINGVISLMRDGVPVNPAVGTVLKSGDTITTSDASTVRVSVDGSKIISFEPGTSAYITYDGSAKNGSTNVNLTSGAVICQINKPMSAKAVFAVKTPNAAVSAKGTVFRTSFEYLPEYLKYTNASITTVHNLDGSVVLQLYDKNAQPVENSMLLLPKTSAQLISGDSAAEYLYLNQEFTAASLDFYTIKELIKICGERSIVFSLSELNDALFGASEKYLMQNGTEAETSVTETSAGNIEITTTEPPETTETEIKTNLVTTGGDTETTSAGTSAETSSEQTTETSPPETTAEESFSEVTTAPAESETNAPDTSSDGETSENSNYVPTETSSESETGTLPIPAPVPAETGSVVSFFGDIDGYM